MPVQPSTFNPYVPSDLDIPFPRGDPCYKSSTNRVAAWQGNRHNEIASDGKPTENGHGNPIPK